ncbi:MAG: MgtC/SapB family protein, partial [Candidatus Gastranaerophilales bacterium]|nr:MgtC/SapB family protein [Candidatus Gastranaerophilales bacterium]
MLNNFILNADFYITVILRLTVAICLASLLGVERELTGKVAGLRTHILVCAGACVFTLLSIYGFKMAVTEGFSGVNDPARIGAQIITGIGFIGAGTIMRTGSNILGITTAATLWMSAAIGMACGCGLFSIGVFATFSTLFVLILIRQFERNFLSDYLKKYRNVKINIVCTVQDIESVNKIIDEHFSNISKIEKRISADGELVVKLMVTT